MTMQLMVPGLPGPGGIPMIEFTTITTTNLGACGPRPTPG
jgi:hypothetical protein